MNIRNAVRKACDDLGFQTSINTLQRHVVTKYGVTADYSYTCTIRKAYEIEVNNVVDDRTYDGQPKRDMTPVKTIKIKANANPINGLTLLEFMKEQKWAESDVQNALAGIAKLRKLVA